MDDATHQNVDAYIMQFASYLWENKYNDLSEGLLHSLEAFDYTMIILYLLLR